MVHLPRPEGVKELCVSVIVSDRVASSLVYQVAFSIIRSGEALKFGKSVVTFFEYNGPSELKIKQAASRISLGNAIKMYDDLTVTLGDYKEKVLGADQEG